jgi:hypothetical protein
MWLPSSVPVTLPLDLPVPLTIYVQELAYDASLNGNMSNDVVLEVK